MKPIVVKIKTLAASERKITAEIIDCIREIERMKIHLEMGYPSVMEFLVRECGYSETAALRRIDAARIVNAIPEIREDLKSGNLNLSQVSIVAQCVRQKERSGEDVSLETKKELMKAVQHKRTYQVQKIVAQMLALPVVQNEKLKFQADESVRVEFSLTKTEMEILNKAKELLGHIQPGMSVKEFVVLMAERVVREKDPAREVRKRRRRDCEFGEAQESAGSESCIGMQKSLPKIETDSRKEMSSQKSGTAPEFKVDMATDLSRSPAPTRVSAAVRRQVFQRDQVCQYVNPGSSRKCGSRHLLEIDHLVSKWAGGGHEIRNLELKCRVHNQWKYQLEAGIQASFGRSK